MLGVHCKWLTDWLAAEGTVQPEICKSRSSAKALSDSDWVRVSEWVEGVSRGSEWEWVWVSESEWVSEWLSDVNVGNNHVLAQRDTKLEHVSRGILWTYNKMYILYLYLYATSWN